MTGEERRLNIEFQRRAFAAARAKTPGMSDAEVREAFMVLTDQVEAVVLDCLENHDHRGSGSR